MNAKVQRNGNYVTITVPAAGIHMGRNGYAKIQDLELCFGDVHTATLRTINTRGLVTNGNLVALPIGALLNLLEALKAEVHRTTGQLETEEP